MPIPDIAVDIPDQDTCVKVQQAAFAAGYKWYGREPNTLFHVDVAKVLFFERKGMVITYTYTAKWRPDYGQHFKTRSPQQAIALFRGRVGIDCTIPEEEIA